MQSIVQFVRYSIVGLISNGIGFVIYLLLTMAGVGSKRSMTLLYIIGVIQTFFFNKKWTFSHHGDQNSAFLRYLFIYGIGYVLNLGALVIFVDRLGYPHQWVQGIMIPIVAIFLFVMQKIWVFRIKIR